MKPQWRGRRLFTRRQVMSSERGEMSWGRECHAGTPVVVDVALFVHTYVYHMHRTHE